MPTRTGYGAPQLPHRPQHKPRPEQTQSLTPNRPHAPEPTRKALVTRESVLSFQVPGIEAGEIESRQDIPYTISAAGPHAIALVVDFANRVEESNETDNILSVSHLWQAPTATAPPPPPPPPPPGPPPPPPPAATATPTATATATATPPPAATGRIAFFSDRDGDIEIYIMNADGSGQTQLTFDPSRDVQPDLSPDGAKIVFISERGGPREVYTINVDGTDVRRLTNNGVDESDASWCSNTRIAFTSIRDGQWEVYIMDANGSNQTRLTTTGAHKTTADCSADGTKIAFNSARDGNAEVYVMNADGTEQTRLTNDAGSDASEA